MSRDTSRATRNILTIDLEDWQQSTLDTSLPISDRVVRNTHELLDLLHRGSARATFFILGLVAERFPGLVAEVAAGGHEIASHGTSHRSVSELGPQGFRADLRRSIESIGEASGHRILGYRAPDFSISENEFWALEILAEEGLRYDSSIFPFRGPRYGVPRAFREPFVVRCRANQCFLELPLATAQVRTRRLPVAGGGYFRLLPYAVTRHALRAINRAGAPATFYLHPYELDVNGFAQIGRDVPLSLRIRQGTGRRWTAARLSSLLRDFSWVRACDLLDEPGMFSGRHLDLSELSDGRIDWSNDITAGS
jgi:polysaccharide deacetylase family protein (PEP-CTERM system associated)